MRERFKVGSQFLNLDELNIYRLLNVVVRFRNALHHRNSWKSLFHFKHLHKFVKQDFVLVLNENGSFQIELPFFVLPFKTLELLFGRTDGRRV